MKSLKIIQTLAKIAKIISKVLFICCIVGACGCVVGMIALAFGVQEMKIGERSLEIILMEEANTTVNTLYAIMVVGIILSAGEAVICKFAENYFAKQLEAGSPFDFSFAKATLKFGILVICIPLIAVFLSTVCHAIMRECLSNVAAMNLVDYDYSSVGLGVVFILFSLVYKYGAEVVAQSKGETVLPESDTPTEEK